jgi:tight adherence protein B
MMPAGVESPWVGSAVVSATVAIGLLGARFVVAAGERRGARTTGVRGLAVLGGGATTTRGIGQRVVTVARATRAARWFEGRKADAERARLLPDFVHAVSRTIADGASLRTALQDGAEMVGEPFKTDVSRLIARAAVGLSLTDALERWTVEVGGEDLQLFTTACVLGAESGRGTADALSGVGVTLADRREVQAESHALTSQARSSAAMLVGLPVVFTLVMSLIDPSTLRTLFATTLGLGCLIAGLALDALGAWWMHRMIEGVT